MRLISHSTIFLYGLSSAHFGQLSSYQHYFILLYIDVQPTDWEKQIVITNMIPVVILGVALGAIPMISMLVRTELAYQALQHSVIRYTIENKYTEEEEKLAKEFLSL